jgi:hypothetical protein
MTRTRAELIHEYVEARLELAVEDSPMSGERMLSTRRDIMKAARRNGSAKMERWLNRFYLYHPRPQP